MKVGFFYWPFSAALTRRLPVRTVELFGEFVLPELRRAD